MSMDRAIRTGDGSGGFLKLMNKGDVPTGSPDNKTGVFIESRIRRSQYQCPWRQIKRVIPG
jgi:hypothetical protein